MLGVTAFMHKINKTLNIIWLSDSFEWRLSIYILTELNAWIYKSQCFEFHL